MSFTIFVDVPFIHYSIIISNEFVTELTISNKSTITYAEYITESWNYSNIISQFFLKIKVPYIYNSCTDNRYCAVTTIAIKPLMAV